MPMTAMLAATGTTMTTVFAHAGHSLKDLPAGHSLKDLPASDAETAVAAATGEVVGEAAGEPVLPGVSVSPM